MMRNRRKKKGEEGIFGRHWIGVRDANTTSIDHSFETTVSEPAIRAEVLSE